jgi:hypothetical protein
VRASPMQTCRECDTADTSGSVAMRPRPGDGVERGPRNLPDPCGGDWEIPALRAGFPGRITITEGRWGKAEDGYDEGSPGSAREVTDWSLEWPMAA